MKPSDRRNDFAIQIDAHQCSLSQTVTNRMRDASDSLARQVEHFPVASLHVLVERNARANDYSVKTDLFLTGETLVCREQDAQLYTAYERCLEGLAKEVQAYKNRLDQGTERQKTEKGTRQTVEPTSSPDMAAIDAAVRDQDYAAFRTATFAYEESVRKRIGRWVERYPKAEAQIGKGLKIADLVEEVFLDAFEKYARQPVGVRFGEWLEGLIDPAVKELLKNPDAELENIRQARSARAAEEGRESV